MAIGFSCCKPAVLGGSTPAVCCWLMDSAMMTVAVSSQSMAVLGLEAGSFHTWSVRTQTGWDWHL